MSDGDNLSLSRQGPFVNYVPVDFDGINVALTSFAQARYSDKWTDFNEGDFGVVMRDMTAFIGDKLTFMLNAHLRELFPSTAIHRQSLVNFSKGFDFQLNGPESATVDLEAEMDPGHDYVADPITIGLEHAFSNGDPIDEVFFQPIAAVVVNTNPPPSPVIISCIEGEKLTDSIVGVGTGTANQRWQFPRVGVVESTISIKVNATTWTRVNDLTRQSATAQVYKIITNEEGETFALFGDGKFGAMPASGATITSSFRVGGGRRGNLAKETIETIVDAPAQVQSIINPERSSGGEEPQNLKSGRTAFASTLSTLYRGVSTDDYAKLALQVPQVAKAKSAPGFPAGARIIKVFCAPQGGGALSTGLKADISAYMQPKKMVTNQIRIYGPYYRDVQIDLLIHVLPGFKATTTEKYVRDALVNSKGTGLLDFSQLDFGGVDPQNKERLVTQTRLQSLFRTLHVSGVDRVEINKLTTIPTARAKDSGNSGNGLIEVKLPTGKHKRRDWFVVFTSPLSFKVYERVPGTVTELTDLTITDDAQTFDDLSFAAGGYTRLYPTEGATFFVKPTSAALGTVNVISGANLFALTSPGTNFYLDRLAGAGIVNNPAGFTSDDGSVNIVVSSGTNPYVSGDNYIINLFPQVGDLVFKGDEYPQLQTVFLNTKTAGGSKI